MSEPFKKDIILLVIYVRESKLAYGFTFTIKISLLFLKWLNSVVSKGVEGGGVETWGERGEGQD